MQGGGGPLLTGTIEESQAFNCHAELRSLAQFGMTLAEPVLQLAPSDCTTKEVSVKAEKYLSLRADECRRGNPVKNVAPSCHPELDSGSIQRCVLPVTLGRSRNKFGMTPTESVLCLVNRLSVKKCAFTMAEILLSLTIIGVVAAITLPSLTGNINERTWNTQRKALYARMSQAIALMPALNGYGTLTEGNSSASAVDTAAETFITSGLSKVLKINNICDSEHLEDCGITSEFINLTGSKMSMPAMLSVLNSRMTNMSFVDISGKNYSYSQLDSKSAAFETQNGESINLFYNPHCVSNMNETKSFYSQNKFCVNMIYDLNGLKGPNTVGKDIGFISVFYPTDSVVVAPNVFFRNNAKIAAGVEGRYDQLLKLCTAQDKDLRLPNIDEANSMFINSELIGFDGNSWALATSSKIDSSYHWEMNFSTGRRAVVDDEHTGGSRCIGR